MSSRTRCSIHRATKAIRCSLPHSYRTHISRPVSSPRCAHCWSQSRLRTLNALPARVRIGRQTVQKQGIPTQPRGASYLDLCVLIPAVVATHLRVLMRSAENSAETGHVLGLRLDFTTWRPAKVLKPPPHALSPHSSAWPLFKGAGAEGSTSDRRRSFVVWVGTAWFLSAELCHVRLPEQFRNLGSCAVQKDLQNLREGELQSGDIGRPRRIAGS